MPPINLAFSVSTMMDTDIKLRTWATKCSNVQLTIPSQWHFAQHLDYDPNESSVLNIVEFPKLLPVSLLPQVSHYYFLPVLFDPALPRHHQQVSVVWVHAALMTDLLGISVCTYRHCVRKHHDESAHRTGGPSWQIQPSHFHYLDQLKDNYRKVNGSHTNY